MNDVIDQVHYDHISMSKILNMIEQEIRGLDGGVDPDYHLLVSGMSYLVNYSDLVHHPKEDAMFQCLIEKAPDQEEKIAQLRDQHENLAKKSMWLLNTLKSASLEEFVAKQDIKDLGHEYIQDLRHHMNLEEGHLLRVARNLLTGDDLKRIEREYAHFRDPLLSDELEQEYEALYQYLLSA